MKFRIILPALVLFFSCNNTNKDSYSRETAMFKDYFESTFNRAIQNDSISYILVPSNACLGCIGGVLAAKNNLKPNVIVLTSGKAILRNHLEEIQMQQLFIDSSNEIDKLPFHKGNIGQLKCANGRIYAINSYDATQMGGLIESITLIR